VLAGLAPQAAGSNATVNPGDAGRGQSLFEHRCTGCHALDADREGPHLRGAFGRKAGSVPDFSYSAALKNSGLTWDESSLDRWLRDTDAAVPDNNMGFSVPKAQDRADIIAFLKTIR
jgi:cytochrome c